jgi:hypothetical protein
MCAVRRVLVTVKRGGDSDERDLELPAETPTSELSQLIHRALGWQTKLDHVRLEPGGRRLDADRSLLEAGASDGAWLVFSNEGLVAPPAVSEAWPTFVPNRAGDSASDLRLPILVASGTLLLLALLLGFVLLRPQTAEPAEAVVTATLAPTAAPALVPTAVPTLQPTAPPTEGPTLAPTAPPTQAPKAAPTRAPATPIAASSLPPDAASVWPTTLSQLDSVWNRDWPRVIELTQSFLSRFPDYPPATEKLYVALVEYGRQLEQAGRLDAAQAAFQGADQLQPLRTEARAELNALLPTPTPPLGPPPTAVPPRVVQPAPPPAEPPAAAPAEPTPPPEKRTVTRDGYAP